MNSVVQLLAMPTTGTSKEESPEICVFTDFDPKKATSRQIITHFNIFKIIHDILNVDFSLQGVYKQSNYLIELHECFGNVY